MPTNFGFVAQEKWKNFFLKSITGRRQRWFLFWTKISTVGKRISLLTFCLHPVRQLMYKNQRFITQILDLTLYFTTLTIEFFCLFFQILTKYLESYLQITPPSWKTSQFWVQKNNATLLLSVVFGYFGRVLSPSMPKDDLLLLV